MRIRLSRNISGFPFPGSETPEDEDAVKSKVAAAFDRLSDAGSYSRMDLSSLPALKRRVLLEKNLISPNCIEGRGKALFLRDDERISCLVNDIDHLRLSMFGAGLDLKKVFESLASVEIQLEDEIDFAVSLDWGYLNTEVTNLGTGLKASVMLHLPALAATSHIEKAVNVINQLGLSVKGFMADDERSLGNMYQVSNQLTIGISETDILEKLEGVALQLVNYERKAREEMIEQRRVDVEDSILESLRDPQVC